MLFFGPKLLLGQYTEDSRKLGVAPGGVERTPLLPHVLTACAGSAPSSGNGSTFGSPLAPTAFIVQQAHARVLGEWLKHTEYDGIRKRKPLGLCPSPPSLCSPRGEPEVGPASGDGPAWALSCEKPLGTRVSEALEFVAGSGGSRGLLVCSQELNGDWPTTFGCHPLNRPTLFARMNCNS